MLGTAALQRRGMEERPQELYLFTQKILIIAGVVLLFVGLYLLRSLVLMFFLAILIAILWSGMTRFLLQVPRVQGPRGVWVVVSALTSLGVLAGAGFLFFAPAREQFEELIQHVPAQLDDVVAQVLPILRRFGVAEATLEQLDVTVIFDEVTRMSLEYLRLGLVGSLGFLMTLFVGFFLAYNPGRYRRGFLRLVPVRKRERVRELLEDLHESLLQWLKAAGITMVFVGTLIGITLWALGIPYALLFGVASGILELVPFIGPFISFAVPFAVALTISVPHAIGVAIAWSIIQSLESGVITPGVMAIKVALPPAITIMVIIGMGQLFGFLGVLLATPILAIHLRLIHQLTPDVNE